MAMAMQMNNLKVAKITSRNIPPKKNSMQKSIIISCKLAMQKGESKNNFYQVLSLGSENVGFDEIKQAYRRQARRLHPDVCPSSMKEESTKKFIELQKAYETLSDPVLRKMYDYEMGFVESTLRFACVEKREERFPKEVWERQLYGLKQRCRVRMEKKNKS